jgi:hypothetical protein
MTTNDDRTATLDAMIAELAQAARENAEMLADLLAARGAAAAAGTGPAAPGALAPELLELVAVHARDSGMSVDEYVHEAVLAYIARPRDGDGDGASDAERQSRVRDAVRTARGAAAATGAVRASRRGKGDPPDGAARGD